MRIKITKKIIILISLIFITSIFFSSFVNADDAISYPDINSPSALLMELSSGKILYEKNIDEKMYPASLTKVMTAIIALENCNLDDIATVSSTAVNSLEDGYVTANLQVDEELTIEQLLYVLMVGSSNDAAIVIAEHISGSVENFSDLMNEKAKSIGCTSTNFVNPNGVHDENHYSTARDLALIAQYAMKNQEFKTLVSTTYYKLPITNKYDKEDRIFKTTNSLLLVNNLDTADNYYYKYATGIKTGFTTPAQECLIASSNKDNLEFLTVILGATSTSDGLSQRYLDTKKLFEYAYSSYSLKEFHKKGDVVHTTNIKNATQATKKLDAIVSQDIDIMVKNDNLNSSILPEINLNSKLKAPIKANDKIGSISYNIDGTIYTYDILAESDVNKSYIGLLILTLLILILTWCFIKIKRKNKKTKYIEYNSIQNNK